MPSSSRRSADKPLFYAFLALFIWLPLPLGSNRGWSEALMISWVAAMALWWLLLWSRNKVKIPPAFSFAKPAFIILLVYLLWVAFQLIPVSSGVLGAFSPNRLIDIQLLESIGVDLPTTISQSPYDTKLFLLKSIAYVLLFSLTLLLLNNMSRIKTLMKVLIICGVAQAIYAVVMVLSGYESSLLQKQIVAEGTYANRNHLAGYLEMCLAIGLGLMLASTGGGYATSWQQRLRNAIAWLLSPKIRLRLYLAFMVVALVLTRSRMGNTAFFVSLGIMGFVWIALTGKFRQKSTWILLLSIFVIDIYIVGEWFGLDKVIQRIEATTAAKEQRDEVVVGGMVYLDDYSVVGSGGGSFYTTFPRYRGTVPSYNKYAHNDYLQFALEVGLVGLVLLGVLVVWSFYLGLRAVRSRRRSTLKAAGFASSMAIIELLIHSSVDFNLQIPANSALFMLLVAMSWLSMGYKDHKR